MTRYEYEYEPKTAWDVNQADEWLHQNTSRRYYADEDAALFFPSEKFQNKKADLAYLPVMSLYEEILIIRKKGPTLTDTKKDKGRQVLKPNQLEYGTLRRIE